MRRHALSDEQWLLISEFLPAPAKTGRPRSDSRRVVDGILWVVRTGAPWRDLPERFGPWQTVYHWFNAWSRDGTWDRILEALQMRLDADGHISALDYQAVSQSVVASFYARTPNPRGR